MPHERNGRVATGHADRATAVVFTCFPSRLLGGPTRRPRESRPSTWNERKAPSIRHQPKLATRDSDPLLVSDSTRMEYSVYTALTGFYQTPPEIVAGKSYIIVFTVADRTEGAIQPNVGAADGTTVIRSVVLAYNLGNFLRRLALARFVKHWSLSPLREQLIRVGAKVVRHAKYVTFQMAEVAMPRELFAAILDRIQRFGVPPPLVQRG